MMDLQVLNQLPSKKEKIIFASASMIFEAGSERMRRACKSFPTLEIDKSTKCEEHRKSYVCTNAKLSFRAL
jgi:hypothetical protein